MKSRMPVAVATALALSGCFLNAPGATGGKVAMQTKVAKVQVMTRTFSLTKNQGLSKATESFKQLASALQSAFSATAMPATSPKRYCVEDAFTAVRAAGMRATYKVSGVADFGDAKLIYDDATGEVTAIQGPNAKITFTFTKNGNQHAWDAVIEKSPDGTTGKFHIEVTGTWREMPMLMPMMPAPMPMPRPRAPLPVASPAFTIAQVADDAVVGPTAEEVPMAAMPTMAMPSPPPYKWLGNEMPDRVESVSFTLAIAPKGDAANAMTMSGAFDEPGSVPNSSVQVPTHWKYSAVIPKVTLDWESRLKLALNHSTFAGNGTMAVNGDNGKETFTLDAKADEAARTASLALTNVAAKVTLLATGSQKNPYSPPDVKTTLVSAEDGSKLGDVALDPKRPRFAIVTFTDGTKMDWELYPEGLIQSPPMGPSPTNADFDAAAGTN